MVSKPVGTSRGVIPETTGGEDQDTDESNFEVSSSSNLL
jgi:hypothetical protein